MDSKKVIQQLIKIAEKQQKIIEKLAQQLPPDSLPTSQVGMSGGHQAPPANQSPPQHFHPNTAPKKPAAAILERLPANIRGMLYGSMIEVHNNNVTALAKPSVSDQEFNTIEPAVQSVVTQLAQSNVIPPGNYKVTVRG